MLLSIRIFDANRPEKMIVLSKVRLTVVRLNRIFLTRLNANHLPGKRSY